MGCETKSLVDFRLKKKLLSATIATVMLLASFVGIVQIVQGEPGPDSIVTYKDEGGLVPTTEFDDEEFVVVNVTVNGTSGDPPGGQMIIATNVDTGEWVEVMVSDNMTPPENNIADDGEYWGRFQINSSAPTGNGSGDPGSYAILHVQHGETINITEDFDNDADIGFEIITANYDEVNTAPNLPSNEVPQNESFDVPVDTILAWNCSDPNGDSLVYDVSFGEIGNVSLVASDHPDNIFDPGILEYNTTYGWKIVANDGNATTSGPDWQFTTETESGPQPPAGNSSIGGYVLNGGDTGIENAVVEIFDNSSGYSNMTQTSPDGQYVFNNLSIGTYDLKAYKPEVFPNIWISSIDVSTNNTHLQNLNFTVDESGPGPDPGDNESGNLTMIRGNITDDSSNPLGNVSIELRKHGETQFENFTITNETGQYSFDLSNPEAGPGMYELMAMCEGYVSYVNFSIEIQESGVHWIDIELTEFFSATSYIRGYIKSNDTEESLSGAELIILDTDSTHMMETEGKGDFEYTSNDTGYYNIPINYSGTFNIIAFKDGYYAKFKLSSVENENSTYWCNLSLDPAAADNQTIHVEFTDLDDVSVTVNRTIIAESPMIRFALDFMPETGNNNQIVSQTEVEGYLAMISEEFGPTVNVTLGENENEGEGGPPDFLQIPANLLLDGSNLDSFVPGTYDASLENVVNTTVNSDATIYYNATFNLTLDGDVLNQLLHNFTVSSEYAVVIDTTMNVSFAEFYTVNTTNNNTNMSIQNNGNGVVIQPGNGTLDELAYAWIILDLNTSTAPLPLVETPTWHVTDEWVFNKKSNGQDYEIAVSVSGKPFRQWDRYEYMVIDENASYLCYDMRKENRSNQMSDRLHATINNVDWIHTNEGGIAYIVNDLDFPLYNGKQWETVSWWGEPVTATVINTSATKETQNDTFTNNILVNYTNATDSVVGQEWYNPSVKCYINRTKYDAESIAHIFDLKSYKHAPFIQSTSQPYTYDEDNDSKIDAIKINITLNTSGLTEPTDYILEGSLYKETGGWEPPTEITWIDEELENLDNSNDTVNITISYRGSLIRSKEVNGPYAGWLEFRELGDWGPEATIDYTSFETESYNYSNFASPAVTVSNVSDFGNDTNNNTRYDYLTLNLTLNITESGNYSIQSSLEYVEEHIHWDEWWWITGAGTENLQLNADSEEIIQLNFDGREIYDQAYSGVYQYHLEVMDEDTWQRVYEKNGRLTHSYNYSMFETPSLYFNKTYMNQYSQHDYISGSDFIVNTSIIVEEDSFSGGSGTYELHGGVHYGNLSDPSEGGDFITGNGEPIVLTEGENLVQLTFDASDIYQRIQEDGIQDNVTFEVGLGFCEKNGDWYGPEIDNTQYFTQKSVDDFPEPPVNLLIQNDSISANGDWLIINASVALGSAAYTGDYEIHGGVHWIDNSSGEQDWRYITGNGTQRSFSSTGNYTVQIKFSGMEIAASGHDGPYMIWMGMESYPDWIEVANDEYQTEPYVIANFTTPSVTIDEEGITEEINGTDYFTIHVPINVTESGEYDIHGGVHWIDYSQGWDDWRFITGTGNQKQLSTGPQNISLNFDQGIIKNELENNDYCGKLMLHIGVEDATTWNPIASTEYETNQGYCADDFASSGINIVNHSFNISENGDLVLNVTINSSENCSYSIHGGVHWIEQMNNWENWVFITGIYEQSESFTNGTNYKEYEFNGGEIYNSMENGPYKVWFSIENQSYSPPKIKAESEFEADYLYTDFAGAAPGVRIIKENMSAGTVDYMNTTQSGSFLTVNVSINKSTAGTDHYWLDGGLEYVNENTNTWEFISGTGKQISLTQGLNIKPLNFNAGDIYSSGYDGPYTVWIALRNMSTWTDEDNYEYTTQSYTAEDAPAPPISFAMENGNASFSYINGSLLTINATINVTNAAYAGEYEIHGGVEYWNGEWWHHITGTGTWTRLENGTNVVTLNYNAGEINESLTQFCSNNPGSFYDAQPYSLAVFMGINPMAMDDWNEIARCEYETQNFTKGDFPGPSITMDTNGYYINDSYFTVNLTIDVSNGNQGQYDIHGGVHWIDYSQGWDDWRFITGTGQDFTLQNGTNNVALNFNGGEIHQALQENGDSKLSCWIGIEQIETWQEITHAEFETTETYTYSDFPGPGVVINLTDDYINQSGQFLTVNATITATEDYQNTFLDLHGGIHWTQGWEWRFITGTGRQINLTSDETNVSINFNGGAIRSTEHNGPYEVWIGVSEPETWEDLTHKEYTTAEYNYTAFAPPNVQIIENACTDYANGSQYITVNASLNVNETGTYFLEGELFWKEGYRWHWITWNGREITVTQTGIQNVTLNFDATELARAEEEGWTDQQLHSWLAVKNSTTWTEIHRIDEYQLQGNYSIDDFVTSPISFNETVTEYPTNASGGNAPLYTLLNISIPVNISTPGNYEIGAALFDPINNTIITQTTNSINNSETVVNISFNGTKISKKRYNGSFEFRAKVFNSTTKKAYDSLIATTGHYDYTDFVQAEPEATLEHNFSSYINNGNLIVNVTVNVSSTGNGKPFEIYGELFHNQTKTYITYNLTNQTLDEGERTVQLVFNGSAIQNSTLNGPYALEYLRLSVQLDNNWEELEVMKDAHTTSDYTHDQFGGA